MANVILYITAANKEEGDKLAQNLVRQRLAACANVIDGLSSYYWWDGAVQNDRECLVIAKTVEDKVDAATGLVKSLHSYDVPCVVALPIVAGNPDFLNWIQAETAMESPSEKASKDFNEIFEPDGGE